MKTENEIVMQVQGLTAARGDRMDVAPDERGMHAKV